MSYKFRSLLSLWCMLGLVAAAFPAGQVSFAQETYYGPATNVSVITGGTWQHDASASSSADGIDLLVFTKGNAQFVVISGTTDIARSFSLLEIAHPVIDIEVEPRYALRAVDLNGTQFSIFQVAIGDGVQTIIAPVSTFGDHLTDAQANIQVNGASVMIGVDGHGVAAVAAVITGGGDEAADISVAPLLGDVFDEPVNSTTEENREEADVSVIASPEATTATVAATPETDDAAIAASPEADSATIAATPETDNTTVTASPVTDAATIAATPETDDTTVTASPVTDAATIAATPATDEVAIASPVTDASTIAATPETQEATPTASPVADNVSVTGTPESDDATTTDSVEPPGDETGFVDANTFVSPQFGHTVTWTDDWTPATDKNGEPTFVSRVNGSLPYDEICLTSTGKTYICVYIRAQRDDESLFFGPNSSTQETHTLGLPYFATVTTDTAGSRGYFDLTGNATVREERLEGNILIRTHVNASLDILPDQVAAAQAGIQIDGVTVFSLQNVETLRLEVETVSASIPGFQAERDQILADMGLANDQHFVSNAMACDVAWSPAHALEVAPLRPIGTRGGFDFVADAKVSEEYFNLVPTEDSRLSFHVICYESITAAESIYDWGQAESTIVEGDRVLYRIDEASSSADESSEIQFRILVKPASGPAVEIRVSTTMEALAMLEPETLVINGVDISEAITEDAFIDQLP